MRERGNLELGLAGQLNAATGSVGLNDSLLDNQSLLRSNTFATFRLVLGRAGGQSLFECNLEFGLNGKVGMQRVLLT